MTLCPDSGQNRQAFGHWHLLKSQPRQQNKDVVCSLISKSEEDSVIQKQDV